ncbi:MAG: hypothetical protein FWG99_04270 [Treponema sp.]|nr:hypothetical protein [Treponema sp.]
MNKNVNFEDTIFILNVRIRMVRDLLRLDTDTNLFLHKSMDDLEFIGSSLEILTEKLLANTKFIDREGESDNLCDAEWQFNRLLTEFAGDSSPFSAARFPEIEKDILKLKAESSRRRRLIDETSTPSELSESGPAVSRAELSELLKGSD